MHQLTHYDAMRHELEMCVRIDEAADIRDKASALQAYARQRDDKELEVWTAEIKLRACTRIGEISRDIETAPGTRSDLTSGDRSPEVGKDQTIRAGGLAPRTARDYEQLAGPRDQQAQHSARAAAETYFATSRADKTPATMKGLRGAVRGAIEATLGPPPARRPISQLDDAVDGVGNDWVDWTSAVKSLANAEVCFVDLADKLPAAGMMLLNEALQAADNLSEWIGVLEEKYGKRQVA